MLTSTIDKKTQRTVIAKLRGIAAVVPDTTFLHVRTRATKARPESNEYSLFAAGAPVVQVRTTNEDTVKWDADKLATLRAGK